MKALETISDPVELVWAIREKIYKETKNMTREEKWEYRRKAVDAYYASAAKSKLTDDFWQTKQDKKAV
jgi:hypothetical protein